jgi:hypothetical protein
MSGLLGKVVDALTNINKGYDPPAQKVADLDKVQQGVQGSSAEEHRDWCQNRVGKLRQQVES